MRIVNRSWLIVGAAWAAALHAAPAAAAEATPPLIPIENFVARAQYEEPRLSPDGKKLVVTVRLKDDDGKDTAAAFVYELATMKQIGAGRLQVFEEPTGYVWVTNDRILFSPARQFGSLDQPQRTGEIMSMDLSGRSVLYLYGYHMATRGRRGTVTGDDFAFGAIHSVPRSLDGTFVLREHPWEDRSRKTTLYRIDAANAARHEVTQVPLKHAEILLKSNGEPGFAFGQDEALNPLIYWFDDDKKAWVPSLSKDRLSPVAYLPDDTGIYALTRRRMPDGREFSTLVRASPKGEDVKVLIEGGLGVLDIAERDARGQPFGVASGLDRPRVQYLDASNPDAQLHSELSGQFAGSYVHFVNFSQDGQILLFKVTSDRQPSVYYLLDRKALKATRLFTSMPKIDPDKMAPRLPIQFKARDGLELHGYVTLPAQRPTGPLALVLLPHGGPHDVFDDWFFDEDAQFLASRGYAVLQVNYRGSGGRGVEFRQSGFRQWGTGMQDDLIDAVKWAIDAKVADPARICAYGGSFGAYSAMMVTVRAPELFKCAVGYSGLYDLDMMAHSDASKTSQSFVDFTVRAMGTDSAELARNSPTRLADKINVPVMLIHGKADETTPPEQAEAMHAALQKAGKPHEYLMVPNEGHGFYSEKNRVMFYQRLETFLAKYLKD